MAFQYDATNLAKMLEVNDPERRIILKVWRGPFEPDAEFMVYSEDGDEKRFAMRRIEDKQTGKLTGFAIVENSLIPELRIINGRRLSEDEVRERVRLIVEGLIVLFDKLEEHYKGGVRNLRVTFIPRADSPVT